MPRDPHPDRPPRRPAEDQDYGPAILRFVERPMTPERRAAGLRFWASIAAVVREPSGGNDQTKAA